MSYDETAPLRPSYTFPNLFPNHTTHYDNLNSSLPGSSGRSRSDSLGVAVVTDRDESEQDSENEHYEIGIHNKTFSSWATEPYQPETAIISTNYHNGDLSATLAQTTSTSQESSSRLVAWFTPQVRGLLFLAFWQTWVVVFISLSIVYTSGMTSFRGVVKVVLFLILAYLGIWGATMTRNYWDLQQQFQFFNGSNTTNTATMNIRPQLDDVVVFDSNIPGDN